MRRPAIQIITPNFDTPIPDDEAVWTIDTGPNAGLRILLLTPAQFAVLADGTQLRDLFGVPVVKGRDRIDDDTRFGRLAYGLPLAP